MTQPPNPPGPGSPQQPGGWTPQGNGNGGSGAGNWQTDPTQQLPAGQQYPTQQYPGQQSPGQPAWGQQSPGQPNPQQYPPTQPLPAQEQYPGTGWGQQQPQQPGQPGQPYGAPGYQPTQSFGAPGQYGPPGQSPAPGQYGGAGVPPTPPPAPPGGTGGGRNPAPLIIGIVAGVVALGLLAWFLFLRPAGTATPPPATTTAVESPSATAAPPSVLITPTPSPTASDTPSVTPSPTDTGSASPSAQPTGTTSAACSDELSSVQCEWAVYLRKYLVIGSCQPDSSDPDRNAFRCTANPRGKLKGDATVTMRWADNSKDLTALMTNFFSRAGVAKSKIGSNWKNPPAHTNWWYNDSPKTIRGKLGSADAKDGSGRVAWTFSKQRFYIEAVSERDSAETMLSWWSTK